MLADSSTPVQITSHRSTSLTALDRTQSRAKSKQVKHGQTILMFTFRLATADRSIGSSTQIFPKQSARYGFNLGDNISRTTGPCLLHCDDARSRVFRGLFTFRGHCPLYIPRALRRGCLHRSPVTTSMVTCFYPAGQQLGEFKCRERFWSEKMQLSGPGRQKLQQGRNSW